MSHWVYGSNDFRNSEGSIEKFFARIKIWCHSSIFYLKLSVSYIWYFGHLGRVLTSEKQALPLGTDNLCDCIHILVCWSHVFCLMAAKRTLCIWQENRCSPFVLVAPGNFIPLQYVHLFLYTHLVVLQLA